MMFAPREDYPDLCSLVDAGQYDAAATRVAELLQTQRSADLLMLQGEILHNLSRHADAANCFSEAADSETHRPEALAGQALALCNLKRYQDALELCEKALALDAECVLAHKNKAHALMRLQQVLEAGEAAAKAVELAPDYAQARVTKGLTLMLQMQSKEAEQQFRKALELDANCAAAHANLGFMLRRLNRLDEAAASLEQAVNLRPRDHVTRNNLALCYIDCNRPGDARFQLEQALEHAPGEPGYLLNLAALLRNQGLLDEAIDISRQVLDKDPDNLQAMTNISSLLLQAGSPYEALESARMMVKRVPDAAVGHYNLAVSLLHVRRPQEGEQAALRARELGMDAAALHLALAQARQMQEDFQGALEASEQAMQRREDAKSHFSKAMALKGLGLLDEAVHHYRKSIEFDPEDAQGANAFLGAILGEEGGAGLSEAYLRRLFNQYAGTYDSHLIQALEYRGPALLGQALEPCLQSVEPVRILDLGCGTGLCGPVLRPWASELVGVDISENMVRKARALGVYDRLECAEACAFLEGESERYHSVVAGDVLVYIGELSRVFAGVAALLLPEGFFAFTLEKLDAPGYKLGAKNRFRHSREYVEELADTYGFRIRSMQEDSVRSEENKPVASWVCVLQRV